MPAEHLDQERPALSWYLVPSPSAGRQKSRACEQGVLDGSEENFSSLPLILAPRLTPIPSPSVALCIFHLEGGLWEKVDKS